MYLVAVSHLDWIILQTKRELMAKKKKNNNAQSLSPEKYIITKARKLPLGKTYICRTAAATGIYAILVTRAHAGGTLTVGFYLIDTYCLGVKDSTYYFSMEPDDFHERLRSSGIDYEEADYVEAHNLIYGALEYAEEAGIGPAREFKVSEYILEPDDEKIPLMDFEFGHNGMRELVIGPDYKEMKYIPVLEKNVPEEFIVTGYLAVIMLKRLMKSVTRPLPETPIHIVLISISILSPMFRIRKTWKKCAIKNSLTYFIRRNLAICPA